MPPDILDYFSVVSTPSARGDTPQEQLKPKRASKRHRTPGEDSENISDHTHQRKSAPAWQQRPVRRVLQSVEVVTRIYHESIPYIPENQTSQHGVLKPVHAAGDSYATSVRRSTTRPKGPSFFEPEVLDKVAFSDPMAIDAKDQTSPPSHGTMLDSNLTSKGAKEKLLRQRKAIALPALAERRSKMPRMSYSGDDDHSDSEEGDNVDSDDEYHEDASEDVSEDEIQVDTDEDDQEELHGGLLNDSASAMTDDVEENLDETEELMEVQPTSIRAKRATSKVSAVRKTRADNGIDLSLPPISAIDEIFLDVTSRALKLGLLKAITQLAQQPIRVATMCSGTEAPLLALKLVERALRHLNRPTFQIDHVFSAEIEPFKQAYIERNFQPPILFRDITEFITGDEDEILDPKGPKATTVYGSKLHVPGEIDILVAGSSCVDNSVLNNQRKEINQSSKGESAKTFFAVVGYAKRVRPPIVILENVIDVKAWTAYQESFRNAGYATQVIKADTKRYYIPHTRLRKYMICLDKNTFGQGAPTAAKKWGDIMVQLERRASTPVTSFLLPNDDPRYKTMQANSWSKDAVQRTSDWEACRGRHEKARAKEKLGRLRPVTKLLPEWSDRFLNKRPERDQDVIDIEYLRFAALGTDILYKTRVMDLSQNVDRQAKSANGISGCLTPRGFPFITDQCRPLSGYENLLLQGIPIDDILFTSESDNDLKDLAGNAMSSTVVGSALLAALIVAHQGILASRKGRKNAPAGKTTTRRVDDGLPLTLSHEKYLLEVPAADDRTSLGVSALLRDAAQSARFCTELCEGTSRISKSILLRCEDCKHTACARCAGNPAHNYARIRPTRMTPDVFETRWRKALPLQLKIENLPDFDSWPVTKEYISAVKKGLDEVLTLDSMHRGLHWIVSYVAEGATLELRLSEKPTWTLFIKPPPQSPAGSELRQTFKHPVARSRLGNIAKDIAVGWEWFIPTTTNIRLEITGSSEQGLSWRSKIGLQEYRKETMPKTLIISTQASRGTDVSGTYNWLPRCGTACGSLYVRETEPPLYFFLDPDPIANDDFFVFAENHHRLSLNEARQPLLTVKSTWRPWDENRSDSGIATSDGTWLSNPATSLRIHEPRIRHSVTDPAAPWKDMFRHSACSDATVVLSTRCPGNDAHVQLTKSPLSAKSLQLWKQFAWMLSEVTQLQHLSDWIDISTCLVAGRCKRCSPEPPSIKWRTDHGQVIMHEDHIEAAGFERKMKARPESFRIQLETSETTTISLAISLVSLAHRAAANLLPLHAESVCWNLDHNYRDPGDVKFSKFCLRSNADDAKHLQPARMIHMLREDQLRSLHWMAEQEKGVPFILSEVEEALLPQLNWKVEVKASTKLTVRGGVLADQPSYGKTVTTLALIHDEFTNHSKDQVALRAKKDTELHLAATLIITPPHLAAQWRDEVNKFLPNVEYADKDVLLIKTQSDLKSKSIADLQRAKIVITSWKIFESPDYAAQLAKMSAFPDPGSVKGRQYKAWLQNALPQLKQNLSWLDGGIKSFAKKLNKKAADLLDDEELQSLIPPSTRKARTAAGKGASKKASRANTKVEGVRGRDNWESLAFPIFHMFRWNRIVVDEFSYLLQTTYSTYSAIYASVTGLDAKNRWVLSGTPPLANFADVKMIANFLDVNLGIDDYDPRLTSKKNLADIRKELSPVEKFRSYQDRHSVHWHKMRHELAQNFLDSFVRQNDADVEKISCYPALEPVILGTSHRAVYEELAQYLKSLDMQPRQAGSLGASRDIEINDSLENDSTAEGALLYRASVFDTDLDSMIERRKAQLDEVKEQLRGELRHAEALRASAGPDEEHYRAWKTEDIRDIEANAELQTIIKNATLKSVSKTTVNQQDAIQKLRQQAVVLRPLARELASRIRSLRYVTHIRRLLEGNTDLKCISCNGGGAGALKIFSHCGHLACDNCIDTRPKDSCVVKGCGGHIDELHIKSVDEFGSGADNKSYRSGAKVFGVVDLLRRKIPQADQAVLFVPSYMLMDAVGEALNHYKIPFLFIDENQKAAGDIIKKFCNKIPKDKDYKKVLILNMADEQASGLNLTNANHIIFLSPLLAQSQYHYDSTMTQTVRRVRRYGQTKPVYVHRFVALNTIDVDILELREQLLSEPLFERKAAPNKSALEPNEKNKPVRERARLKRNAAGQLALVPKSAIPGGGFVGDFASHVKMEYGIDVEELWDDDDDD